MLQVAYYRFWIQCFHLLWFASVSSYTVASHELTLSCSIRHAWNYFLQYLRCSVLIVHIPKSGSKYFGEAEICMETRNLVLWKNYRTIETDYQYWKKAMTYKKCANWLFNKNTYVGWEKHSNCCCHRFGWQMVTILSILFLFDK